MTMNRSPADYVSAVRAVVGPGQIPLLVPSIGQAEIDSVRDTVTNDPVGYTAIDKLQTKIAAVCGTEQALLTSCGTAALHLALMCLGVKPGTEVLVPALTFVGTANAVSHCGAIANFIDCRSYDLGVNPFKLGRYLQRICERRNGATFNRQSGRQLVCVIAVDLLGIPCDMDAIKSECSRWGLPVVEDAAQALGSTYKGKPCGSNGHIGILSFNNNKIVTTNGGGALLTDDAFVQARAWSLATTARLVHPWQMDHSEVAYNYRMGNINAALGLPQLDRLSDMVTAKRKLNKAYAAQFDVEPEGEPLEASRSNHWLSALVLSEIATNRDEILAALHHDGISVRTLFRPINDMPMYKHNPRDNLEESQMIWRRVICLPSSAKLGEAL